MALGDARSGLLGGEKTPRRSEYDFFPSSFAVTRMLWSRGEHSQRLAGWLASREEGNISLLLVKNWTGCKDGDSLGEATKSGAGKVGLTCVCVCSFPGGGVGC